MAGKLCNVKTTSCSCPTPTCGTLQSLLLQVDQAHLRAGAARQTSQLLTYGGCCCVGETQVAGSSQMSPTDLSLPVAADMLTQLTQEAGAASAGSSRPCRQGLPHLWRLLLRRQQAAHRVPPLLLLQHCEDAAVAGVHYEEHGAPREGQQVFRVQPALVCARGGGGADADSRAIRPAGITQAIWDWRPQIMASLYL